MNFGGGTSIESIARTKLSYVVFIDTHLIYIDSEKSLVEVSVVF